MQLPWVHLDNLQSWARSCMATSACVHLPTGVRLVLHIGVWCGLLQRLWSPGLSLHIDLAQLQWALTSIKFRVGLGFASQNNFTICWDFLTTLFKSEWMEVFWFYLKSQSPLYFRTCQTVRRRLNLGQSGSIIQFAAQLEMNGVMGHHDMEKCWCHLSVLQQRLHGSMVLNGTKL